VRREALGRRSFSAHCGVIDEGAEWSLGELGRVLREQAGLDLVALTPASGGESRTAFWITDRAGTVSVLKIMPAAGPEAAGRLRAIDINPPVLAGDRAFDLATLLFYLYDHDELRDLLHARLMDLAGPQAARAYLAHMVLRQVDWSLRFHPAAMATRRHLNLARLVTADID
jgi:hypothetical protein